MDMKDLFDMTRRERRGMVVLLIAIAAMLVLAVAARYHKEPVPTTAAGHELVLPDEVLDTVGIRNNKPGGQKSKRKSSKKHQQRKPSTPKPEREPRRLDPVPQFHLSELP